MPITPYEDVPFNDDADGYYRTALTPGIPLADVVAVTLRAFRTTEHRDGGLVYVLPKLQVSTDGGHTYDPVGVSPTSGGAISSGLTPDTWHRGPWVWDLGLSAFEGVTHFRIALQVEGEAFGFCRAQLEYALERRLVTRVPSYRRVIASTEATGRWRLTEAVRPPMDPRIGRATFAIEALSARSGAAAVRPIWFYNETPGDETTWTFGGYLHSALTAPGTYTSDRTVLSGNHPLYAFGFEIQRTGGTAGHTAFALVQGTFALY